MSSTRSRSGGMRIGYTFRRYSRSRLKRPSATARSRSTLVAATTRTSTLRVCALPRRSTSPSCSTRSSLACADRGSSPSSSSSSVPPWARSKRPARAAVAPVKAPFSAPNSSLSISSPGSAAQLTATKGLPARGLRACRARAKRSLPTPVSPVSSTVTLVGAAFCSSPMVALKAGELPTRLSWLCSGCSWVRSACTCECSSSMCSSIDSAS